MAKLFKIPIMQTVNKTVKFRNTHDPFINTIFLSTEYFKAILHYGVFDIHISKTRCPTLRKNTKQTTLSPKFLSPLAAS